MKHTKTSWAAIALGILCMIGGFAEAAGSDDGALIVAGAILVAGGVVARAVERR